MICTVGHGARTVEELVAILTEARVGTLVDVRRFPGSRRHPQFGRDALAGAIRAAGLEYTWQGETLGGHRTARTGSRHTAVPSPALAGYADHMDSPAFRDAIDALVAAPPLLAVICAESHWTQCHRMLIADALTIRGARVEHLGVAREPHRLSPGVRRGEDGWPVYDAQPALPGL
ncbi:DUF488 domain-containing protein [Dactylosporangium sp. NPDC000244]|uniref:DUF488 domain-containing protein n=1 Tax=Dactylosporangium sp. NPDC000244 TaxID=3154365 RepID=UPI0033336BC4